MPKGPKKGSKQSAKHRAAISAGLKKMYAKMSAAKKKAHMAPAHRGLRGGKGWSAARRKARGDELRGRRLTAEHRAAVSAGLKRYHAARRKAQGRGKK